MTKPQKVIDDFLDEETDINISGDAINEAGTQGGAEGHGAPRPYTAVCVTPCTFRGQYWFKGREYRGFVRPPKHFDIIDGGD